MHFDQNGICLFKKAKNVNLIKDITYRFKLNCYYYKNNYYFDDYKIIYYIEQIDYKNNTFANNNFTLNHFLILDINNHSSIDFYLNDNSGIDHNKNKMILISKDKLKTFIKNINNKEMIKYHDIINEKITSIENENNNDYLIININNRIKNSQAYILVFSKKIMTQAKYFSKEIIKGNHYLIYATAYVNYKGVFLSSKKNMKLLSNPNSDYTDKIIVNFDSNKIYIYLDSSRENDKLILQIFYTGSDTYDIYNYKFLTDKDLIKFLNEKENESFFIRKTSNSDKTGFYSYYFFDIQDEYYIYTKKYFGTINLYKYKKDLDLTSKIYEFMNFISYYDDDIYEIMNNKLFILSGTQFYNYYINDGAFYDFFIQKVNDNNCIDIKINLNNYSRNTVKLLNGNKYYNINGRLNHLIKLDNNFLDAEITFIKNNKTKYILNKNNKILDLKDNDFIVISNKIAIIYFYEKIQNYNDYSIIEFDKLQKGKSMEINITNINDNEIKLAIAKDFGFKNSYPMIDINDLEIVTIFGKNTNTIYIENYYDLLELNIYELENEKYYIYIFEVLKDNKLILLNKNKVEISQPLYFESVTKISKLNFNIIQNTNKTLILKSFKNISIDYQLINKYNYNIDINFKLKIIDSNGNIIKNKEPRNDSKNFLMKISQGQTIIHSFKSKNEFLLLYGFSEKNINYRYIYKNNYRIIYLNINKLNIFSIGFIPISTLFTEYYIIISRKNDVNNLYTFSNPYYILKLIMNHSESDNNQICIKHIFHQYEDLIFEEIDINKIRYDENDEYIINIISYAIDNRLNIYSPVLFNEKSKNKNSIKLEILKEIYLQPEKNYLIYEHLTDEKLVIYISIYDNIDMILTDSDGKRNFFHFDSSNSFYNENKMKKIAINKKGKYLLEFINLNEPDNNKNYIVFYSWVFDKMIEEIDFSKNIYSGFCPLYETYDLNIENLPYYKVSNLSENKKVYFISYNYMEINDKFIICENKYDNCQVHIYSYNFMKGKEYRIYIKNDINIWKFYFLPIFQNTTKHITKEGHYIIDSPKIFIIDHNKEFYFDIFNIKPYFVSSADIIHKYNNLDVKSKILNGNNIYSFFFEKYSEYRTIILIPENNDNLKQLFITNKKLEDSPQIKIKHGQNSLINIERNIKEETDITIISNFIENYFESYTSPIENIRFVSFEKNSNNNNKKFIYNFFGEKYLYIDNNNNSDIFINKKIYEPKYTFFMILNEDTSQQFHSMFGEKLNLVNNRINTDEFPIKDFINIYIDKLDANYNLYIKKYYGPIQLYESQFTWNNKTNIDIFTKPINNLKEKKTIFNRLIKLNENQIITGYISDHSFIDIYIEQDNNNKNIYLSDFKNKKYLKKGIEYQFHFSLNHLIKLESEFKAEIIIYNYDTKIIINEKNQTGILIGDNFKIKSNNNAMVYFYPKTKKNQILLRPKKGEIIEIRYKTRQLYRYRIDFGFEGFEPPNFKYMYSERQLYIENIYDKLETTLSNGEYLFLYYNSLNENLFEINYISNNIIVADFKFNFNLVKSNKKGGNFIIPRINREKTKIEIHHCKPPYKIVLDYLGDELDSRKEYNGKIIEKKYCTFEGELYKIYYQSENDFILSYNYNDSKDLYIINNKSWENDRIRYKNLTINYIKIINDNLIDINFNVNYKNSLTKYIIIITPENKNNTFENLKNYCYLTQLINQKQGNFIIEEFYDIGENDNYVVSIDISKLRFINQKGIINIISQELRFDKNLKFYEPKEFYVKNKISIKNIIIIGGVVLILVFAIVYYRSSYFKINSKKIKSKRIKENLGTELNDFDAYLNDNK